MLISTILFLACNGDVAPEETTTSTTTTTEEGCSGDSECSDGKICEETECIDGDRNNSAEEAEAILWDDSVSGFINPAGDIDYYTFSAHGGEYIRITTEVLFEDGDTVVVLRDPTGQILTWSDDFPTGTAVTSLDSVIYAYLPYEGDYLISVEDYYAFNNSDEYGHPNYDYTLSLTSWDQVTAEPDEMGDASLTVDMDSVNLWDSVGVHIQEVEDSDWIELNYAPQGDEGISPFLYVSGTINLDGSSLTPQVRLRDENGDVLSDFVGVGPEGVLLYPNMTEGKYWMEIKDENDGGGDDYWTFLFLISRDYTPYPTETESNDSQETANALEMTTLETSSESEYKVGKYFGELSAGDVDWFSFSHDYPEGQIVLCLSSAKYGSTTAPFVQITDLEGNIIVEGDASTDEPNFGFQDFVSETGEYFISIQDDEAIGLSSDWYQFLVYSTDFEATSYDCP